MLDAPKINQTADTSQNRLSGIDQDQDLKQAWEKPEPPKDEGNFVFYTFFSFGIA